jgi:DNA processing protein
MVGERSSTHPPLPPTTEDERLDWLRLLRSRRVGVATFRRLLHEHGSARAALKALPHVARAAGVSDYAPCPEGVALAEFRRGLAEGARLVARGEPDYPPVLAELADAPPLLWALGDASLLRRPTVAVVGARNASSLGLRMARALAHGLGEAGLVVASGLARGIDTEAHRASLATGTIAVMAGGVDHVYPEENAGLAAEITRTGVRVSEHPMGLTPQARHFPERNRIVAGLGRAVVVVEAAERSGSLITARLAAEAGREVLAVPGHPMDPRAAGCLYLIREGATLVRGVDDVLEVLRNLADLAPPPAQEARPDEDDAPPPAWEGAPRSAPGRAREPGRRPASPAAPASGAIPDDVALRDRIVERLGPSPLAEDQLIRDLGLAARAVAPALMDLELEGRVLRQPGGLLALAG